jgi:fluoroquinolone resistance protein
VERFEGRDSFEDELFADLDLERMDLAGREFSRCTFRGCKLSETKWMRARLEECVFEGCDLTRAKPSMLSLRDVELKRCKLMGIDWSDLAKFPVVSFEECNLRYSAIIKIALRKTRFTRCSLVEASFIEADLVDSLFEECQFDGARFEGCDLRRTRFPHAKDLFVDPAKNNVKGMQVPLETAIHLASSFGMRVIDFDAKPRASSR